MKLKDFIFEKIRYDHKDFDGYKGEINISINYNNTNYFIKGEKYYDKKQTERALKNWLKENIEKIEKELQTLL